MGSQLSSERRVRFNEQSHRAIVPDSADLNFGDNDFCLLAVFKTDSVESSRKRRYLLSKGNSDDAHYCLCLNERGRLLFETGFKDNDNNILATSVTARQPVIPDIFHAAVALRRASGKLEIYLDGALLAESGAGLVGSVDNVNALWLGNSMEGGNLGGELSSVRLFAGLPSELELQSLAIDPESGDVLRETWSGRQLDMSRAGLLETDSKASYIWKDRIDDTRSASLRAEVIASYSRIAETVVDDCVFRLVITTDSALNLPAIPFFTYH